MKRAGSTLVPGDALPEAEDSFDFLDDAAPGWDAGKAAGEGHRARLRQRLLTGGAEALADYEVLEYLLFAAIPRGNTKPIAKALLAQFGSLAGVLNADARALQRVKGLGEKHDVVEEGSLCVTPQTVFLAVVIA